MTDSKNSGRDPKLYRQYALLSRCYIELTLYREAEAVATRALELNPRADLARHGRAMARWKLGNLRGATAGMFLSFFLGCIDLSIYRPPLIDLDTLVNVRGARLLDVRKARETVHELLRVKNQEPSPSVETSGASLSTATVAMDPSWPHPNMVAAKPTNNDHDPCDKNEVGYFRHSPPCFDYNRSKCLREDCPYSHIPDTNSIRGIEYVCLPIVLISCVFLTNIYLIVAKMCASDFSCECLSSRILIIKFNLSIQWHMQSQEVSVQSFHDWSSPRLYNPRSQLGFYTHSRASMVEQSCSHGRDPPALERS